MKQEIEQLLQTVLKQLNLDGIEATITPTDDPSHGDYATSVAFQAAKKLGKSPMEAAEKISIELRAKGKAELVEKIEVAKPGFINFTLSHQALFKSLSTEHNPSTGLPAGRQGSGQEDSTRQSGSDLKAKKIMVEFTDPNPFKELHIGHLYSNIVGESISRLLEANGAEVRRVCYQGDVGLHVAKALWGLISKLKTQNAKLEEIEKKSLDERAKFLGESYALGATEYEENETAKQEIIEINKAVYQVTSVIASKAKQSHEEGIATSPMAPRNDIRELYTKGRQWSLDYFESVYQRLGTRFTKLYFESDAGPIGLELVKSHPRVFQESQGATIFAGEEYGLHTRVFINSLGLPTYEAKELGLAVTKYGDYSYDQSIMITGNEINEYFKVLLKALLLIRPEIALKMKHISHGIVRLADPSPGSGRSVKMSSRTGKIVRAEWLLDEAVNRAREKIDESKRGDSSPEISGESHLMGTHPIGRGVSAKDADDIAELVGVGAVKWALLKNGIGKDIEFSFDESVSFEGNSGPYLQYTYVRTQSLLVKGKAQSAKRDDQGSTAMHYPLSAKLAPEERGLLVLLSQYSDIVEQAAEKYSPSTLATYLFELAQLFNNFYQKYPILKPVIASGFPSGEIAKQSHRDGIATDSLSPRNDKESEAVRDFRLALTTKVGETLKSGLYLLGIESPERM